jgi:hypothetical protein
MSLELSQAIQSLRPNSEFSFTNNDYSTIVWDKLEGTPPTAKAVLDEVARLKAADLTAEADRVTAKAALLNRLGITQEEATLLLS